MLKKLRTLPRSYWVKIKDAEVGTPDILGCHRGRFVALEVKREGEKLSKIQGRVLEKIHSCHGQVFKVCPKTWDEVFLHIKEVVNRRFW